MSNDTFRDYLNNKLGSIDSHVSELIPDTAELRAMRVNNPELYRDFIDRWLTTIDDHIVDIINGGGIHPGPIPPTPTIYDYYYENINCRTNASYNEDRSILNIYDTYPILRSGNTRNWEILLNYESLQTDSSERAPLGINQGSNLPALEIYQCGINSDTVFFHRRIDGTTVSKDIIIYNGNINNKDLIIRRIGTTLDILVDNIVVHTITTFSPSVDSNTKNINVGFYSSPTTNYYFVGIINKFGFRWL